MVVMDHISAQPILSTGERLRRRAVDRLISIPRQAHISPKVANCLQRYGKSSFNLNSRRSHLKWEGRKRYYFHWSFKGIPCNDVVGVGGSASATLMPSAFKLAIPSHIPYCTRSNAISEVRPSGSRFIATVNHNSY